MSAGRVLWKNMQHLLAKSWNPAQLFLQQRHLDTREHSTFVRRIYIHERDRILETPSDIIQSITEPPPTMTLMIMYLNTRDCRRSLPISPAVLLIGNFSLLISWFNRDTNQISQFLWGMRVVVHGNRNLRRRRATLPVWRAVFIAKQRRDETLLFCNQF